MANILEFSSDNINIFILILDRSSSMDKNERDVIEGLKLYQKSFENFPEANSIAVSVCKFNGIFYRSDFERISEFSTDYYAEGSTALYYSIEEGANYLKEYMKQVTECTGCVPRATFILLSDGESYNDKRTRSDAERAISDLNYAGVTTVFVAFGSAINSEFGKNLGFMSTIDVKDRKTLTNFLGVELSKSCKEQSQSLKALGANFFSQAANNSTSAQYSQTTAKALDDDSWFNDI